jgi:hypothetical protein
MSKTVNGLENLIDAIDEVENARSFLHAVWMAVSDLDDGDDKLALGVVIGQCKSHLANASGLLHSQCRQSPIKRSA